METKTTVASNKNLIMSTPTNQPSEKKLEIISKTLNISGQQKITELRGIINELEKITAGMTATTEKIKHIERDLIKDISQQTTKFLEEVEEATAYKSA